MRGNGEALIRQESGMTPATKISRGTRKSINLPVAAFCISTSTVPVNEGSSQSLTLLDYVAEKAAKLGPRCKTRREWMVTLQRVDALKLASVPC